MVQSYKIQGFISAINWTGHDNMKALYKTGLFVPRRLIVFQLTQQTTVYVVSICCLQWCAEEAAAKRGRQGG